MWQSYAAASYDSSSRPTWKENNPPKKGQGNAWEELALFILHMQKASNITLRLFLKYCDAHNDDDDEEEEE